MGASQLFITFGAILVVRSVPLKSKLKSLLRYSFHTFLLKMAASAGWLNLSSYIPSGGYPNRSIVITCSRIFGHLVLVCKAAENYLVRVVN